MYGSKTIMIFPEKREKKTLITIYLSSLTCFYLFGRCYTHSLKSYINAGQNEPIRRLEVPIPSSCPGGFFAYQMCGQKSFGIWKKYEKIA